MIVKNRDQRVAVLVDIQNLYYSGKNLFNSRVNYKNLLSSVLQKRLLVRAIAYVIKADESKENEFFNALHEAGFEVKEKPLQTFYGGAKKGDWDIGIAMDAIEMAAKLDVIVLVSGDGDYVPLVEHLRRGFGCKVEGLAFGGSTSGKLREALDSFYDLESNANRFLLGARR